MTRARLPTTPEASADLRLPAGRRSKEVRSLRRLGEELSQRGRTEPLKNRTEQQIRQETITGGRARSSQWGEIRIALAQSGAQQHPLPILR
ncbi:hypothetical protein NDU88_011812 [Pleurodeles waltl]|uniref:Uncharacterized protein n=1 Tax=Pleurodeles waltl TaxID=8319 RepID=A0AAV7S5C4_PLEWA|nr:hypothetical protein NDU88_011812 [Pleurodeles waltl]